MDIVLALSMLVVAVILTFSYLRYMAVGAEKRMTRMMERKGLNIDTARLDDPVVKEIIDNVRSRCRKCQAEDYCERWLNGEVDGDNTFCRNANVFRKLAENTSQAA
jgi:hypothetical protein